MLIFIVTKFCTDWLTLSSTEAPLDAFYHYPMQAPLDAIIECSIEAPLDTFYYCSMQALLDASTFKQK